MLKLKILKRIILILIFTVSYSTAQKNNAVVQYSTIDALLNGMYDGDISLSQMTGYGNFGLGTFNRLDGEMIVLDGKVYRVQFDGKVVQPDADKTFTPFFTVANFSPEKSLHSENNNLNELKNLIDKNISNPNSFYAVKIEGKFKYVKTRSVRKQSKPYPPLSEAVKNQSEFQFTDTEGTIVGFKSPEFIKGINVPGFHFHFLNKTGTGGGHLLKAEIKSALVSIQKLDEFRLLIPDTDKFRSLKFSEDRSKTLNKIEEDK